MRGAHVLAGLKAAQIEDSYIGNVISAGLGQAAARQVILGAGTDDICDFKLRIPNIAGCEYATEATTVNKVCASGMKSVMLAAAEIQLGHRVCAIQHITPLL